MNISKVSAYGVNPNFAAKAKKTNDRLMSRQDSTYIYPNAETPKRRSTNNQGIQEVDPTKQKTKKVVHMMDYGDGVPVPVIYFVPVEPDEVTEEE